MHKTIEPSILYFGTPVVLLSTVNEDGTSNLSPMSSIFWLGWRCMIGLDAQSKTTENLINAKQCVINLPSEQLAASVNRLALTTGTQPVPEQKRQRGYRHLADKFSEAGLTPVPSETVEPPRVLECPVQLEAVVMGEYPLADDDAVTRGYLKCFELRIQRVHIEEALLACGKPNHIDPNQWRPLIMSFQRFYGLGAELHDSCLATVPEESYKSPDIDYARSLLQ